MMKRLLGMLLVVLMLTGCGVNIKQEGNKIYTDISKDEAYAFSNAALKTKGYKVTEESKINYYISAKPEFNETFKIDKADNTEVKAVITDKKDTSETVVTILAMANGNIDEKKSKEIATQAVEEIIKELDLYGKFTASKDGEYAYQIATPEQVNTFILDYFNKNSIPVVDNGSESKTITVKESAANSPFNEPLEATVSAVKDETNKVTVKVTATVKGNYNVKANQQYAESFVSKFLAYLEQYPVVEKGLRFSYKYISFDKAFNNTKEALIKNKYVLSEVDNKNYVISSSKNKILLSVTFTKINNNIAVNLEAVTEGTAAETKDALTAVVTDELNAIRDSLAQYQTILTTDKLFISTSQDNVEKFALKALRNVGYAPDFNKADMTIAAVSNTDKNKMHFLTINNLGAEGISIEINTAYNALSANAEKIVKTENDKLLKALNAFDKQDLK